MTKSIIIVLIILTNLNAEIPKEYIGDSEDDIATIEPESFGLKSSNEPSFSRSKRILATKIYRFHKKAFYSNCDYTIKGKKLVPIHKTCGFHYRKNKARAARIEWEHIVPAWYFGHNLDCWKRGGRKECRESNAKFRAMEADMHNLVPAIGEINGDRSNYPYGHIRGEKRVYGKVDFEVESAKRLAEPKKNLLGDIARVYLYMRDKYHIPLSAKDEAKFIKWNNSDPVSRWEKKKNLLVKKYQGNVNKYVSHYKKLKKLEPLPKEEPTETTSKRSETKTSTNNTNPQIKELEESFIAIKNEIEQKLEPLLKLLPKPVAAIVVFILAVIVFFIRKKKKN